MGGRTRDGFMRSAETERKKRTRVHFRGWSRARGGGGGEGFIDAPFESSSAIANITKENARTQKQQPARHQNIKLPSPHNTAVPITTRKSRTKKNKNTVLRPRRLT